MFFASFLLTLGLTVAELMGFGSLGPVAGMTLLLHIQSCLLVCADFTKGTLAPWIQGTFGTGLAFRIVQGLAMKFALM